MNLWNQTALLNVRQMGEADRLAEAAGTPAFELMANAGKAVASAIEHRWSARHVTVLCGPGNNGGDGFVAARQLAESGWPVRIALLGPRDSLSWPARQHAELWRGVVEPLTPAVLDGAELVVDAIFGAGLSRSIKGSAEDTLAAAANKGIPIVAIDVPSGLMGDTGVSLGAVASALTVTFFRKKPGHLLLPGRLLCGEVIVADIGIPPAVLEQIVPDTFENDPGLWISDLPRQDDGSNQHTRGHAVVGPSVMTLDDDEFSRLFDLTGDRLTRTRNAARRSGAVIVLQGRDTVITAPDGRSIINANVPPALAAAGSGDVLRGIVLGLITQGMDAFLAAAAAVWLYSATSTEFGPGLMAAEMSNRLPGVLRRLHSVYAC